MAEVKFGRKSTFSEAYSKGQNQGAQRRYRDEAASALADNRARKEAEALKNADVNRKVKESYASPSRSPLGPPLAREATPLVPGGQPRPAPVKTSPLASGGAPSAIELEGILASSGFGREAIKMTADRRAREQEREDEATKTFVELVGKDPVTAIAFAKQNGLPIPPSFEAALQDKWFSGAVADWGARLKIEYDGDPKGYQRAMGIVINYLKGQLDRRQGIIPSAAAAQVPTAGLPTPNPPPKFQDRFKAYPGLNGTTVYFNERTGESTGPIDWSKTGTQQRPTALMKNAEYLVATTGVSLVEAINRVLTQRPQHEQSIWQKAYSDVMRTAIAERTQALENLSEKLDFPRRYTNPDNSINVDRVVRAATIHFENRLAVPQGIPAAPAAAPPPAAAPAPAPTAFKPVPVPKASLDFLHAHQSDPEILRLFNERYGQGAAEFFLGL